MILLFIALSYFLGLNTFYLAIPLSIVLGIVFFLVAFFRYRKKGFIFVGIYLLGSLFSGAFAYMVPVGESFTGVVIDSSENYYLLQSGIYRFYVYEKENDKQFGDFVSIDSSASELKFTTYESQFDFKAYLNSRGVRYSLNANNETNAVYLPLRLKARINAFKNSFDDNARTLIDTLLFNNRNYNSSLINNIDTLNIIFIFSMSGIYFSLLLRYTNKLIKIITKKQLLADILAIVFYLPLIILSFPKISILRVGYVYILKIFNEHVFKKKFPAIGITSFAMLTMLMLNHAYAYQMGFYIGFLISFYIYFCGDILSRFKKNIAPWVLRLFIFIFMIPISCFMSGSFHPFSIIYQTIFIPVNIFLIILFAISFFITPFHFINHIGFIYDKVFDILSKIDPSISTGDYGIYFILIYYVFLIAGLYFFEIAQKKLFIASVTSLISSFLISFIPVQSFLFDAIYFINVGQGDATLIQNRHHAVLIDTGGNLKFDMAKETLIPFFKKRQIYKLDALVTTHNDYDHNGAATSLLNSFPVDNYLTSKEDFPYQVGDIYLENLNLYNGTDDNDNSLVFNLSFMNKRWLLMGDASIAVEKYMMSQNIDLDCDILKVGHHGSKTSTCEDFIKASTPDVAIISVGANNTYHHPNKEVIDILNKYNVVIRRTDMEGTISYRSIHIF